MSAGLAPVRTVLANGAVVVAKEARTTPAVSMNITLRAGAMCDPVDAPGATWLLSRLLDRGAGAHSASDIAEALDARGITLTVTVTKQLLSIVCTCLAEDFVPVLSLVGEIITTPTCPAEEIGTRKGEVITAIRQDDDNPFVRAAESLMALLYPGHPYGRRTKGSVAAVEQLTREQLLRVHAARFAPSAMSAAIVGDVPVDRIREAVEFVFGAWAAPSPAAIPLLSPPRATTRRRQVIPMMNKSQADLAYGFTTIARSDPAYYAYWLMNHVLGQYSLGGRLGDSIREKQGMAYYVASTFEADQIDGPLMIRAGISAANVDRALASIDAEVAALGRDGMTQAELDASRTFLIGAMPRALETNAGIATFLQQAELFGLGLDYDRRVPDLLRRVTLDEANAAARAVLDPDRAAVVIAGPYVE